jgi:chromosome segregation ATPase
MRALKWRKAGAYLLVVLPVLGLAGIAVIAQQQQDSSQQPVEDPVAEAARKAREHKKEAPKPKKVYTNEDVSAAASSTPATTPKADETSKSAQTEGSAETTTEPSKADKTEDKNSEAAWRKRFKEARDKLAQAEKELDILQREVNKGLVQYYNDPQKALSEQYTRKDINDHDVKIQAKKDEIVQLKQHISDMQDELRRSGGDIGWSR